MGDEFQLGSGNWWDSSRSTRFDSATTPTASSTLSSLGGSYESSGTGLLADPNLHLMGFGLSSHNMDWNQSLLRGGKSGSGFRTILQEESNTYNFQQDDQWRQNNSDHDSSINGYKQIDRGLSLDQPQYSSHGSSSNSSITNFQVDSANPTNLVQGFLMSENQQHHQQQSFDNTSMNYGYQSSYPFPQLFRASPLKQPPRGQLHFSNNTPFWNASPNTVNDARPSFFPSHQTPLPPPNFQEKSKNTSDQVGVSAGTAKKNCSEASNKRARQETTPAMPAFKVRKEKMGDRITALQQLVSPFGKTDTASVLSEAIEYIKFLHDQVSVLSTPYLKSGAPIQPHQNTEKLNKQEGPRQDLRSRGLCLVPVSSTFPVTHETAVDFWTPTFGGTFR